MASERSDVRRTVNSRQDFFAFDLAPLGRVPPTELIDPQQDSEVDQFVLSLALAFNELKLFAMLHYHLAERARDYPTDRPTAEGGQHAGLRNQVMRYAASILNELLELISQNQGAQGTKAFATILGRLAPSQRKDWKTLVTLAKAHKAPMRVALARIRANGTFHFHQSRDTALGFRGHFYEGKGGPIRDAAYVSVGKNYEQTRFYFADAAVAARFEEAVAKAPNFSETMTRLLWAANFAVGSVVASWVRFKHGGPLPRPEGQMEPIRRPRQTGPGEATRARARLKRKGKRR